MANTKDFDYFPRKTIEKPWGREEILEHNAHYAMKKIFIKSGHRMSLQIHNEKTETIYVLKGALSNWTSEDDNNYSVYSEGSVLHIEKGTVHRFGAFNDDCVILECSAPMLDDVIRLSDDYGR